MRYLYIALVIILVVSFFMGIIVTILEKKGIKSNIPTKKEEQNNYDKINENSPTITSEKTVPVNTPTPNIQNTNFNGLNISNTSNNIPSNQSNAKPIVYDYKIPNIENTQLQNNNSNSINNNSNSNNNNNDDEIEILDF